MIKQVVHIEAIQRNGEKRQFQVKLPNNAKRILAIYITANPFDRTWESRFESEVGWIWLRLPEQRDVLFAHKLETYKDNYDLTIPKIKTVNNLGNHFVHHGKKIAFKKLNATLNTPVLEGYYIDRIQSKNSKYQLRIYLTLEI